MELKYGRNVVIKGNEGVLIVPLWNWNQQLRWRPQHLEGSNCTFMELKLEYYMQILQMKMGSNCTFMELKSDSLLATEEENTGSNCTFMELKSSRIRWEV